MTEAGKFLAPFSAALREAENHARLCFPEESCGFIVNDRYVPLQNQALDPEMHNPENPECECRLCSFSVDDADYLAHEHDLQAVVHSHPNGPGCPSKADMAYQQVSGVAWIIVTLDDSRIGPTIVWGGDCPIEPLIGREFIHGVNDCYSLIRDTFGLGRAALAEQGIDWPFENSITLPDEPRNDGWWEEETENDLYEDNFRQAGFVEIGHSEVRPGDVFLGAIRSKHLNHGGVLLEGGLLMHHLPSRLSRREPAGIWMRCADKWIRYVGDVK